jgi:spore germination protein GerM
VRLSRLVAMLVGVAVVVVVLGIVLVPRFYRTRPAATAPPPAQTPAAGPERKITATLFYVSEDGASLIPVQTEVTFGDPISAQARHVVEAQIAAPRPPYVSAIPAGTKLRALYVTERGDAFVDLSGDVTAKHTGGSLDELLSVYAIVNALTVNLPAIARVQILVDGKEVDTLAGHVDLRQPLAKNLQWVAEIKQ